MAELTAENILAVVRGLPAETIAEILLKACMGRPAAGIRVKCDIRHEGNYYRGTFSCIAFDGSISIDYTEIDQRWSNTYMGRWVVFDVCGMIGRLVDGRVNDVVVELRIDGLENAKAQAVAWLEELVNNGSVGTFERTFQR